MLELDSETEARLKRVAEARHSSLEAMVREAVEDFLDREEEKQSAGDRHPAGQPWPRRNPVGGIITPV